MCRPFCAGSTVLALLCWHYCAGSIVLAHILGLKMAKSKGRVYSVSSMTERQYGYSIHSRHIHMHRNDDLYS